MKAISGLTSMFDSLTKVVVSLLALGIAVSLLGGNVPFVGEIAGNIIDFRDKDDRIWNSKTAKSEALSYKNSGYNYIPKNFSLLEPIEKEIY